MSPNYTVPLNSCLWLQDELNVEPICNSVSPPHGSCLLVSEEVSRATTWDLLAITMSIWCSDWGLTPQKLCKKKNRNHTRITRISATYPASCAPSYTDDGSSGCLMLQEGIVTSWSIAGPCSSSQEEMQQEKPFFMSMNIGDLNCLSEPVSEGRWTECWQEH